MKIVLLAAAAVTAAVGLADESAVVALTSDTFGDFVTSYDYVLVDFYAPWCGHCKVLEPEFEAAAKTLQGVVPFAKVDATSEADLGADYEVKGYPTLLFFRHGFPELYTGSRSASQIAEWIEQMTEHPIEHLEENELVPQKQDLPVFLGTFPSFTDPAYDMFKILADRHRTIAKFYAKEQPGSTAPSSITAYRYFDAYESEPVPLDDAREIEQFIARERVPYLAAIHAENFADYENAPFTYLLWLVSPSTRLSPAVLEVAKELRSAGLAAVYLDSHAFEAYARHSLGVQQQQSPVSGGSSDSSDNNHDVIVVTHTNTRARYIMTPPTDGELTKQSIEEFVHRVMKGQVERSLLSEDIPSGSPSCSSTSPSSSSTSSSPICKVVGRTFEQEVVNSPQNVLLEVYAPWCGHCQRLQPVLEGLAKDLSDDATVKIVQLDGTKNEIPVPGFEHQAYPSLFFVEAGTGAVHRYTGARTSDAILRYIRENSARDEL